MRRLIDLRNPGRRRRGPDGHPGGERQAGRRRLAAHPGAARQDGRHPQLAHRGLLLQAERGGGETIDIMVSTDPSARFEIEIFRMGYYGGKGAG